MFDNNIENKKSDHDNYINKLNLLKVNNNQNQKD